MRIVQEMNNDEEVTTKSTVILYVVYGNKEWPHQYIVCLVYGSKEWPHQYILYVVYDSKEWPHQYIFLI
jgi:hypothetical protein